MFLEMPNTKYNKDGQQVSGPADFLILIEGESEDRLQPKAVVRRVKLSQCGHWMMGTADIFGHNASLSGSYGADGLVLTVPDQIYDTASVRLPQDLYDEWNHGGGWNGAGREAESMRRWALANLKELKSTKRLRPQGAEGIPNLEGMDNDELSKLRTSIFRRRKSLALQWFGDATSEWISNVSSMILFLLDAREARLKGNMQQAVYLEDLFDSHYNQIPKQFRY